MEEDNNPLTSLLQLRRDLERFRTTVEEQQKLDAGHRLQLEDELKLTRQQLATAEDRLRRVGPHSLPTHDGSQHHRFDDPFLPASERHRLTHNPPIPAPPPVLPLANPVTPWARWNPLNYIRTPFGGRVERDGSFEFRRQPTNTPAPPPARIRDAPGGPSPFSTLGSPPMLRGGNLSPHDNDVDMDLDQDHEVDQDQDINDPGRRPPHWDPPSVSPAAGRVPGDRDRDRPRRRGPDGQLRPERSQDRYPPLHPDLNYPPRAPRNDAYPGSGLTLSPAPILGPKLKPEDITTFDGENVEFFIASCLSFAALYGEARVLEVVPRALKGVAKDWFLTVPAHRRQYMTSLQGWAYLLREAFGEDERRSREKAEARFFDPSKESLERYFWDKKQMHERAEPGISELHVMREIWKGLARRTPWLQVTSYNQHNIKDFRDELQLRFDHDRRNKSHGSDKRSWSPRDRHGGKDGGERPPNTGDPKDSPKSKGKPSDKGLPPCKHCAQDHYHSECPKNKPKSFFAAPNPDPAPAPVASYSAATPLSCLTFSSSRTIATDPDLRIVELPRAPSVGSGMSFLNGNPLPLEAWLSTPGPSTPTIMGCGDSGGQCLIRADLISDHTITTHSSLAPSFTGVGGSSAPSLGFVVIPLYFPDREALAGRCGAVVKVWIEFQVVKSLDCNFLIGRDATRAYGIDFVESEGHVSMGGIQIPIADVSPPASGLRSHSAPLASIHAASDITIPPFGDRLIQIRLPPGLPPQKVLLVHPAAFLDPPRELHGRIPWTLLYSTCPSLHFTNLCGYPMHLHKGQVLGHVEILASNTMLSFLSVPPSSLDPTSPGPPPHPTPASPASAPHPAVSPASPTSSPRHVTAIDPDSCGTDPFGLTPELTPDDKDVEEVTVLCDAPACDATDPAGACTSGPLLLQVNRSLSPTMRSQLLDVLRRFASVFSFGGTRLGKIRMPPMTIDTSGPLPSRMPAYRESPRQSGLIRDSMATLKKLDIIEEGSGPMAAPVVMILQKGKWRFCVDFRAINAITPLDRYPIPRPDTVFTALSGAMFFSTMDANKGYHQFEIDEKYRHLTAFTTQQEGQWQFKRVPFGLQNAPAFFQRSMDSLLGRYRWQFCLAYIDDVVIWSKTWDDHLVHIEKVLSCFHAVGLTLDENKCNWGFQSVDLLGLRVTRLGLRTLSSKTEAITALPFPRTIKDLRIILGQFSYYRQFIPRFASVAEPLTSALKAAPPSDRHPTDPPSRKQACKAVGRLTVDPTPERVAALQSLKSLLTTAPCLRYPDFARPFFLYTDASRRGIGGALQQSPADSDKQYPILFISRCLSPAETNYSATELECLGIYWCFTKLAHYIDGSNHLTVVTDHLALQWLWNIKATTNSRLHRWAMLLLPWQKKIKVIHRAGLTHSNVDPLSRFPSFTSVSSLHSDLTSLISAAYPLDDEFRSTFHDLQRESSPTNNFALTPDGLLWFRPSPDCSLLCVPAACRSSILNIVHDELGHPGFARALAHARTRYHWGSLSRDIRSYCRSCHFCQVCKTDTSKKPGCLQPIPVPPSPFHTMCVDFIEGLPSAPGGFNSIATVTEKFSKAVRLIPCKKSDTGEAFAKRFFQHVYPLWGVPSRLISDRDRRFVSSFWSTLMRLAGSKVNMTTAYHPQADGQAERTNRTVEAVIRILCLEASSHSWASFLPHIELAHNTTLSTSTGYSPYSILYAHSPRLFGDRALPLIDDISADGETMASSLRER